VTKRVGASTENAESPTRTYLDAGRRGGGVSQSTPHKVKIFQSDHKWKIGGEGPTGRIRKEAILEIGQRRMEFSRELGHFLLACIIWGKRGVLKKKERRKE